MEPITSGNLSSVVSTLGLEGQVTTSQVSEAQNIVNNIVATNPAEKNAQIVLERAIAVAKALAEKARAAANVAKAKADADAAALAAAEGYVSQCEQALTDAQTALAADQAKYVELYGSLPPLEASIESAVTSATDTAYQALYAQDIGALTAPQQTTVNSFKSALEDTSVDLTTRLTNASQIINAAQLVSTRESTFLSSNGLTLITTLNNYEAITTTLFGIAHTTTSAEEASTAATQAIHDMVGGSSLIDIMIQSAFTNAFTSTFNDSYFAAKATIAPAGTSVDAAYATAIFTATSDIYDAYSLSSGLKDSSVALDVRIQNASTAVSDAQTQVETLDAQVAAADQAYTAAQSAFDTAKSTKLETEARISANRALVTQLQQLMSDRESSFASFTDDQIASIPSPDVKNWLETHKALILDAGRSANSSSEALDTFTQLANDFPFTENMVYLSLIKNNFSTTFNSDYYTTKASIQPTLDTIAADQQIVTDIEHTLSSLWMSANAALTTYNNTVFAYNEALRRYNVLNTIFSSANIAYVSANAAYLAAQTETTTLNDVTIPADQQAITSAQTALTAAQSGISALEEAANASAAEYARLDKLADVKEKVVALLEKLKANHLSLFGGESKYLPKARKMPDIRGRI